MKIVSNTSPLIAFSALKKLDILEKLFKEIIIPTAVYEELNISENLIKIENWIKVVEIKDISLFNSLRLKLDYGESAALAYYLENRFDYCLLDDKQARKIARGLNVNVIGTIGILLQAKKKKIISSVTDDMEQLEKLINFRLSDDIKAMIRKDAGESD